MRTLARLVRRRRLKRQPLTHCTTACLVLLCATASAGASGADGSLTPSAYDDEPRLAALLWTHSPDVLEARQRTQLAASEEIRANLYPNPQLDLAWNTIPIGRTTPPDLEDPVGNVPSYTAGLSELVELGKRGPRQAATAAERAAAASSTMAVFADRWFTLLETIGRMAMDEERVFMLEREVSESARVLELERARADKGEIARMQAERSETEHLRLVAARDAARTEQASAQAACAEMLTVSCPPFGAEDRARAFLEHGARTPLPTGWSEEIEARRPDLAALGAALRAAEERRTLAKRAVLPDVTLRLGYTYDTFVTSGAQRQSLAVGMQMPLPISDRGQADLAAASATEARARRTRETLVASGQLALDAAVRRRALVSERLVQLRTAIAKSDELRGTVEGAAHQGGASQVDVLLARRRLQEVLLERTELDFDLYAATLDARRAAALFPQPEAAHELEGDLRPAS